MPAEPTFLIIGAQKAGTTWLSDMVRQHPEVSTPVTKELHFFDHARDHRREFRGYVDRFTAGPETVAIGESTPNYVWALDALPPEVAVFGDERTFGARAYPQLNPDPAATIAALLPDVRLVLILRDPVARAISAFRHHIRMRRLSPSASILGVRRPGVPIRDAYGIVALGFYDAQLQHWHRHFDPERLLVLCLEDDVLRSPRQTLRRLFAHIGVDPDFEPAGTSEPANASASDAFLWSHYYLPSVARRTFRSMPTLHRLRRPRITVTPYEETTLRALYTPGVQRLSSLLDRRFDSWTSVGGSSPRPDVVDAAPVPSRHP